MRTSKLTSSCIATIIAFTGGLSSLSTAADFSAKGYETPAYVDLEFAEVQVNEPAGTVSINVLRTGDFRQTTTIEYRTEADSASEGSDYKATGGTLTFRPGEGFKTITLDVLPDDEAEDTESFRLEITGSSPNTMVFRSIATIFIHDAPAPISPPRLQIASASGNILLSWNGSSDCVLERSTNPGSAEWEPVRCSPVTDGDRTEVTQPCGGTFFFYRLRTP